MPATWRTSLLVLAALTVAVLLAPAAVAGSAVAGAATGATAHAAEPPSLRTACLSAPADRFDDVDGVHAAAVECIGWWGVTQGVGAHRYAPSGTVTRGQMASFLARTITVTGGQLPAAPPTVLTDVAGTTHAVPIDQLHAIGVVRGSTDGRFRPGATVTRGQMASFLAATWEARTGAPLPPAPAPFVDVAGTTHADNIGRVAAAGLTGGVSSTRFAPDEPVTRAQMGSFLARLLALLVRDGDVAYPPAEPVAVPPRNPVVGARIGTPCPTDGREGLTAAGRAVVCEALWPGSEPVWQPRMDAVGVRAYATLAAWLDGLPPATMDIPIHRHPDVPVAYETMIRRLLEAGAPILAGYDDPYAAVLLPLTEDGYRFGRELVLDTLPPATSEQDREELEAAYRDLFESGCGASTRQGRTELRPTQFLIEVFPTEPLEACGNLVVSPTEVAESMAREWLGAALRVRGGLPCWAGEGSGWPIGRALMDHLGLQDAGQRWSRWNVQLTMAPAEPHMLGLDRSSAWTFDPAADQYCYGVGHAQGSLAHELLIDRYGIDGWLRWGLRARELNDNDAAFEEVSGRTFQHFIAEADARTFSSLEVPR